MPQAQTGRQLKQGQFFCTSAIYTTLEYLNNEEESWMNYGSKRGCGKGGGSAERISHRTGTMKAKKSAKFGKKVLKKQILAG